MAQTPTTRTRRVYSFTVQGYRLHEGVREDIRQALLVAVDAASAIADAKAIIAAEADAHIDHWAVVQAVEVEPKEAQAWIAWHGTAATAEAIAAMARG